MFCTQQQVRVRPRRARRLVAPLLAAVLVLAGAGQFWPAPAALTAAAAEANVEYAFGWPSLNPTRVAAGGAVKLVVSAQAKALSAPATLAFAVSALDPAGGSVRIAYQPGQTFTAWQTRRYEVTWAVPATQPAGTTTLRFQLLDGGGAEVAWRAAALTVVEGGGAPATATPTPRPATATPTPVSATATPTATAGGYPRISGSAGFVSGITAALDLMRTKSPTDYAIVGQYVVEIREGSDLAYVTARIIQISLNNAQFSPAWAGGSIMHEATHVRGYYTGQPWYGCDGERVALTAQANYLDRVGEPDLADYARSLIGVWGC
jgi:hypothetical protein